MVRFDLVAAFLTLTCPMAFADTPVQRPSTDKNPVVRIDGDLLTYIGGINANGLNALDQAVRHLPRGQVTRMIVNSGGGDTDVGIFIGSIIADLKPDLTIDVGCFSSCANFIAPAARSITIRENAFLGWHGNDRQFEVIAAQEGVTIRDHLRQELTTTAADGTVTGPAEADLDEAEKTISELVAKEAALYEKIGLANDTFAICGVGTRFDDRITDQQRGWGFSIADMARLGLPPVSYEGVGAYEDSPAFKHWLIRLTPEDCQP